MFSVNSTSFPEIFDTTALNSFLEKEKETLALANLYYLATQANIASGKYKNLALKVHPIACPKLVPLIEKFNFNEAISVLETEYLKKDNEKLQETLSTYFRFYIDELNK